MRLLILLFILLLPPACCGQKVYEVTQGELQFINPIYGPVIKEGNNLLKLVIKPVITDARLNVTVQTIKLPADSLTSIQANKGNIYPSAITRTDLQKLRLLTFIHYKEGGGYKLQLMNNELFAAYKLQEREGIIESSVEFLSPYVILSFSGKEVVLLFGELSGYIIPVKKNFKVLPVYNSRTYEDIKHLTAHKRKKEVNDLWEFSRKKYSLFEQSEKAFYKIDTLPNRKVRLQSYLGEYPLKQVFDSINFEGYFIVGYTGNRLQLFNYAFDRFNFKKLRVVKASTYFPTAQILTGNSLKRIDVYGQTPKGEAGWSLAFADVDSETPKVSAEIVKRDNEYFLQGFDYALGLQIEKRKLKLPQEADSVYFYNGKISAALQYPFYYGGGDPSTLVIYQLRSGKYSFGYLYDLLGAEGWPESFFNRQLLPRGLDAVKYLENRMWRIEKDGLYGYYPLNRKPRYKALEEFKGNFARYISPDGTGGWLDNKGIEYPDDN